MCDNKLQLIFDELYRKTVPCIKINNSSLINALKLAKDHCFSLDGCCSSRVKVSICDFEQILTNPCNEDEKAIQAYFQCPESTCSCCDCLEKNHCDEECNDDGKDKDDKEDKDKDKDKDEKGGK